jgi:hypothetical protein
VPLFYFERDETLRTRIAGPGGLTLLSYTEPMSENREARRRFQFTTRGILAATFWVATFCCAVVLVNRLWHHDLVAPASEIQAGLVLGAVLFMSPPAAIGGLFGRALLGAAVGVVLYVPCLGLLMVALNNGN